MAWGGSFFLLPPQTFSHGGNVKNFPPRHFPMGGKFYLKKIGACGGLTDWQKFPPAAGYPNPTSPPPWGERKKNFPPRPSPMGGKTSPPGFLPWGESFSENPTFPPPWGELTTPGYIECIHNLQNTPEIEGLRYCLAVLFGRYCLDTVLSVPANIPTLRAKSGGAPPPTPSLFGPSKMFGMLRKVIFGDPLFVLHSCALFLFFFYFLKSKTSYPSVKGGSN